ncbi:MAG: TolC family protein, partial [Planctomycetaceae bacterium]|nr:TolC family protein [Planctomycetaceae bacterium]
MTQRMTTGFLVVLLLAGTQTGCRSFVVCCNNLFAWKQTVPADLTQFSNVTDSGRAGFSSADASPSEEADSVKENEPPAGDSRPRFEIPRELPGATAKPLQLPPIDTTQTVEQRRSVMASLFPEIPDTESEMTPDVSDGALALKDLQQLAAENSPVVRQAVAAVEMARGQAIQAGLYPNPTIGYEGDSLGTGRTAGYNGVFLTQEFVTADKLQIAQNVEWNAMRAAQADLRKARVRLATDVRRRYFEVLIAQEQLRLSRAISRLSNEVYEAQIDLVTGGEAAPYEPLQLRVFAVQARNHVIQSQNNLEASWRRLAAAIGLPDMTRRAVAGSVENPVPGLKYDAALQYLLSHHSDIVAAQARMAQAGCDLQLQQVTPIPNVTFYATLQHDDTSPLNDVA